VDQQHRLTAVLADGTRYGIYRSIVEQPGEEVTVAGVATRFALHPNVARMHLTKLERAGLLTTSLRKDGSGGRPARLYRLSDKVSTLSMPPRRYDLLSDLALKALVVTGDLDTVAAVCRTAGIDAARTYVAEHAEFRRPGRDDLVKAMLDVGEEVGMLPELHWDGTVLALDVRNCAFKELSSAQPDLVCVMHRNFLEGFIEQLAAAGGEVAIQASSAISRGDDRCQMRVTFG
jgi:predicted ArsR family transcriptional regulator